MLPRWLGFLALGVSGCGAEVVAEEPAVDRACMWHATVHTSVAIDATQRVTLVATNDGQSVALVAAANFGPIAVARWGWRDDGPHSVQHLADEHVKIYPHDVALGLRANGAIAVAYLAAVDGDYVFATEDGVRQTLDVHGDPRLLATEGADTLLVSRDLRQSPSARLWRLGDDTTSQLDPLACDIGDASVITRDHGYLAAVATPRALAQCGPTDVDDREIEVIAFDDVSREVKHVVPLRDDLERPVDLQWLNLLNTANGPTLLWHDGQGCYGCYAEWDKRDWMQPLAHDGAPAGPAVALPEGWWRGAATAIGDAVVVVGRDTDDAPGGYQIRFLAPDGRVRQAVLLHLDELCHDCWGIDLLSIAASPDGETLWVAKGADGRTILQRFDCLSDA